MSLSYQGVGADSSFYQNRVLAKAVFGLEFMAFLLNDDGPFLDDVK